MGLGLFGMIRLTSPVRAEENEKEKKEKENAAKKVEEMPARPWLKFPCHCNSPKRKNGAFFFYFFFNRGIPLCPSNLLPSSPRTLTRQRISRGICSLLTKGEWAAI